MSFTAGSVMDSSAALLNDQAKQQFTYVIQLPYLKIALAELKELYELNNISLSNETSAAITLVAGKILVSFSSTPALPTGLAEIQRLWERATGIDPYVPMTRKEFMPHYLEGQNISSFGVWVWKGEAINLLPSIRSNDIKIDYIQGLFTAVVDNTSAISAINAESFLHYRTAALCAQFIGENKTRSDDLNGMAQLGLDRVLGIGNKGKQTIATRHRPFRAGFKSRGLW